MSAENTITKDNLEFYLRELAKEYRKLNGTKIKAEIILVGGAAVLASYGFREMTVDIDAIIEASDAMKDAINHVGDRYGLPVGWLNADFRKTTSYSDKLYEHSEYLFTRSNVLEIRTIQAEYLIAMKLVSGRRYKKDLSDIVGILYEQQKQEKPITLEMIDRAVIELYDSWDSVDAYAKAVLEKALASDDLVFLFKTQMAEEAQAKDAVLEIGKKYPDLITADNINEIIEQARKKKQDRSI
ncbi:MAG: hypothetical protein IKS55_07735 [Oscillospiraceae bacterium]|nr:hypothetical protein [Oscillospiraceae bacterium]